MGLKPQRDRVPVGPDHASAWHGQLVLGPLTRSVRDAALFLDVVTGDSACPDFRAAVGVPAAKLRVVVSTNAPPATQVSLSNTSRAAVDTVVEILRSRGHDIVEVDVDYGLASLWSSTVWLLKGVQDDVTAMPNRDGLETRTRSVVRLARLLRPRSLQRALAREADIAAAINAVFEAADLGISGARDRRHRPLAPRPRLDGRQGGHKARPFDLDALVEPVDPVDGGCWHLQPELVGIADAQVFETTRDPGPVARHDAATVIGSPQQLDQRPFCSVDELLVRLAVAVAVRRVHPASFVEGFPLTISERGQAVVPLAQVLTPMHGDVEVSSGRCHRLDRAQ